MILLKKNICNLVLTSQYRLLKTTMVRLNKTDFIVVLVLLLKQSCTESEIGSSCTLESTGSSGVCKLLTDCDRVKNDVIKFHRLPQVCGFMGTQPIVCCPKDPPETRKPGVISKIRCKQYAVYARDQDSVNNECGHRVVKRIVGGVPASIKEFSHMALIGYQAGSNKIRWLCGGSLISEHYVLTAASCALTAEGGPPKFVKVGILNLNDTDHKQEVKIIEVTTHPRYEYRSVYDDIALLKLEKPLSLNPYVRPACLYTEEEISADKAIATGWGQVNFAGDASENLLKVTLDLIDYNSCNSSYTPSRRHRHGILKESQICAGTNGKDVCQGDSGSPLQIHHAGDDVTCMYDIIGIVSFGRSCGVVASVYTRVSYYIKWIEDIVWPERG